MPNSDSLTEDPALLEEAVRFWKITGSALPPTKEEMLNRDMDWDNQCYIYWQMREYYEDKPRVEANGN